MPVALLAGALVVLGTLALGSGPSQAATPATERFALPPGSVTVQLRGNGHGHGMSQYGARGAAIAGHTAAGIVAFYYPGTSLVTLDSSTIRVLLSATGSSTTVAASAGLHVTGVSTALPTSGISRYRLVASAGGAGLSLQRLVGATWSSVRTGLADGAEFSRSAGALRLYLTDGSSTGYRGTLRALRGGGGVLTVNRVALDDYVAGVVPREMPSSWQAAAVQAQAIAARSYGRNAVETHSGQAFDICDTTQCQVYGGMTRYDRSGSVLWTEDPAALVGNANTVLQYGHRTIFAEFSASDGGWTVDGGQPYLSAHSDPYDNAASGDPYLAWTRTVSSASIAGHYGLARASAIEVTGRDGHGTWGGRVTAGYVDGTDAQGSKRRIATTGFGLQAAMGLGTTWFWLQPQSLPIGHLDRFAAVAPRVLQIDGWTFDPDHIDLPGKFVLTVDHVARPVQLSTVNRSDVQRVFATSTPTLGFSVRVSVGVGQHMVCLYAVDRDGLGTRVLECLAAGMPDPLGGVELFTATGLHTARLAGWSFDPSHGSSPGRIQLFVDGKARPVLATTVARPDVQSAFHTAGDRFGYDLTFTLFSGVHQVCVSGVDQDGHGSVPLGCRAVHLPQNPLGRVELLHHLAGGYQLAGWTFDPDRNGGSTRVEVYLDQKLVASIAATAARPDVQRAYRLVDSAVGFSAFVPASSAKHVITIKSLNSGPGTASILVHGWL